jgi:RimJ/RimL family protein N-acetyltransferase
VPAFPRGRTLAPRRGKGAVLKIVGERSVLRPWARGDSSSLVRHANNINVAKHLRDRFPNPYTRADAAAFLAHCIASDMPTSLAIEVDGQAVGSVGFVRGTDVERFSAEVGYWLGEDYWGRGIVTEALLLLTRYLFDEVGLLRLYALPLADNTASIRVLEKAGYAQDAVLRSSCVKYGVPRDQFLYSRVSTSWPGIPAARS